MAPHHSRALISIHLLLLLAASMLLVQASELPAPSKGYSFELTYAELQTHHMKLQFGGTSALAIVDTGSDTIWVPHNKCPSDSDPIKCGALCDTLVGNNECCRTDCIYERKYGEGSRSRGVMVKGKLTTSSVPIGRSSSYARGFTGENKGAIEPGETTKVLNMGCEINYGCPKVDGIVGLGRGELSLPSQLGVGKFSYCLPHYSKPSLKSEIKFGDHTDPLPKRVQTTPLVEVKEYPSRYYVSLTKIEMGDKEISCNGCFKDMFIDSGSSFTKLPKEAFRQVNNYVKMLMRVTPKPKPVSKIFKTCYDLEKLPKYMPKMVLHFNDAKMRLLVQNYMILNEESREVCLAIKETSDNWSTLGNFQQQNTTMLFDLTGRKLSFWRPKVCGTVPKQSKQLIPA